MADDVEPYRTHSRWSDPGRWSAYLAEIPPIPERIAAAVSGLLLHPFLAAMRNIAVPAAAANDRGIRSVEAILDGLLSRDARALTIERTAAHRFFGVCAAYARLATAVFRAHAVPARCRVGFAAYFTRGFLEDHWVCEYWDGAQWRLLDAQLDDAAIKDFGIPFPPWDVPRDQFLDAATVWRRMRAGELDPAKIGLSALGLAGTWFVAGNVMLDVAALNKQEMLPWEKWSVAAREFGPEREISPQWVQHSTPSPEGFVGRRTPTSRTGSTVNTTGCRCPRRSSASSTERRLRSWSDKQDRNIHGQASESDSPWVSHGNALSDHQGSCRSD